MTHNNRNQTSQKAKVTNWTNIIFFTAISLGAVVLPIWYLSVAGFSWWLVAIFFFMISATCMSITAGYHRFLSHRSYDCHPVVKLVYLLFGAGAFQGSALDWATDHRIHHRHVDTEKDPHNIHEGFFHAHIGWIFKMDPAHYESREFPKDLLDDKLVMWQHRNFVLLAILMSFGFPMFLGALVGHPIGGLVFGGIFRQFVGSQSTFLINSYAHTFGRRPYSTQQTARDSFVLAILAFGEGYHNYHHQFASDYRNGVRWYQWDPTKWLISSLSIFNLTYRLKKIPDSDILLARIRCEQKSLLQMGVPAEQLLVLRKKVEVAQQRLRHLYADYQTLKKTVQEESRIKLITMKAELKTAKMEFKAAFAGWRFHMRAWRAIPASKRYQLVAVNPQ